MKSKLKEFIDTVFADAERRAPDNQKLRELKEEMLQNLCDRYEDLVAEGRSPAAAYNIAVTGVGDVSELLDSVVAKGDGGTAAAAEPRPPRREPLTAEEQSRVDAYKHRSAILTSVAVAMYILCWMPLVILSTVIQGDVGSTVGLCIMFFMIAGATAMLIYNDIRKPKDLLAKCGERDDDDDDDDDDDGGRRGDRPARSPVYKAISSALWVLTVFVYLAVSFATGYWHITWMIFLIVTALDNIIKALFDLRR